MRNGTGVPLRMLLDLPREILLEVLKLLNFVEITRCRRVCAVLNNFVTSNTTLLYKIELGIEGLVDGRSGGLCISERLEHLLERRNRWRRLNWTQSFPLASPNAIPQTPYPYELQGGTFLNVQHRAGEIVITKSVLPSRANPRIDYENHVLQAGAVDITTDPTQDLIVVLDTHGRVHVWSLSTYAPHPEAAEPVLRQEGSAHMLMTALHIAHDLVALLEWADGICLTVWNWRTGRTILLGNGTSLPYLATGFTWLTPRAFVIADAALGELAVFSLHGIDCISPPGSRSFHNVLPCARLQLPRIDREWHMANFQLESTPLSASLPRGQPFVADPEMYIIVFTVQYATHNHLHISSQYTGFVYNRCLMSYLSARGEGEPPKVVPWAEWGPKNTRVLTRSYVGAAFARYVHGQRVVYNGSRLLGPRQLVTVYDFNVHPKRIPAALCARGGREFPASNGGEDDPEEDWCMEVVDTPTVIRHHSQSALQYHPFLEDVESTLPYIETSRPVEGRPFESAFMMDEERLVELRLPKRNGQPTASVRVYTF